jgi:hypothetical protein
MGFSKQCTKCRQVKWWYDFYKDLDKRFGVKSICKTCTAEQIFKYQQENKVEYKLYRLLKVPFAMTREMRNWKITDSIKLANQIGSQ